MCFKQQAKAQPHLRRHILIRLQGGDALFDNLLHLAHRGGVVVGEHLECHLEQQLVIDGGFEASLSHSFLTAKQLFTGFFTFFYAIFLFFRPEHDCYAKFTSCSTHTQHFKLDDFI